VYYYYYYTLHTTTTNVRCVPDYTEAADRVKPGKYVIGLGQHRISCCAECEDSVGMVQV
jgi:3-hydroxy-3-methylglutaryl CoA synthase